jgi:hypothetical protein
MSWGYKIALVYGGFVLFMIGMITVCVRQTDINLVSKEYYKEEIEYQKRIDQLANAQMLNKAIGMQYNKDGQMVELTFPRGMNEATGEILFFRPSDSKKDTRVALRVDEQNQQLIPVNRLDKGLWKLKIEWKVGEIPYYNEQTLVIN